MRRVNMRMLRAHLEARARDAIWKTYTANRLWECVQCLTGGKGEVKAYSEIMACINTKKTPEPTESAEDIKQTILSKLGGERA